MSSNAVFSLSRLCAGLATALALAAAPALVHAAPSERYVVQFKPGKAVTGAAGVRSEITKGGGRIKLEVLESEGLAAELPAAAVTKLRRNPNVLSVEVDAVRKPDALTTPSAPPYRTGQLVPYGIKMVQADQLPDKFAGNRKICIIDSGYDLAHEDLSGNDVTGEYDTGTGWWYTDENSHGTHVAGTIAAMNQRDVGVVGVLSNRKVKLHIVKVFGAEAWAYSSSLVVAAYKCRDAGANIISMSLGGALPTNFEKRAFQLLTDAGILVIASAGNGGNILTNYPAGYPTVMSVAAIDENKAKAGFSQFNADVEISAPGVSVLSSVPMGSGREPTLTVAGVTYESLPMDGTPAGSVTAPLADFGTGEVAADMTGKVCLIARGNITFADKVLNCQNNGGLAAVVYNNAAGIFGGTLGGVVTAIPSVSTSDTDGAAMLAQVGQSTTLDIVATSYAYFDGTSMSAPHVSGVAALVWSYFPSCSNTQIRAALNASAEDLGKPGRDYEYGYGLVRAKAAYDYLAANGCN